MWWNGEINQPCAVVMSHLTEKSVVWLGSKRLSERWENTSVLGNVTYVHPLHHCLFTETFSLQTLTKWKWTVWELKESTPIVGWVESNDLTHCQEPELTTSLLCRCIERWDGRWMDGWSKHWKPRDIVYSIQYSDILALNSTMLLAISHELRPLANE